MCPSHFPPPPRIYPQGHENDRIDAVDTKMIAQGSWRGSCASSFSRGDDDMAAQTRRMRARSSESGAELIEFALVYPLLLLVVLGIVDFGFLFQRHEVLTNAAQEGARVAALPGYSTTDVQNRVMNYLSTGGVPITGGNPVVTVTPTTIPESGGVWPATTVNVTYSQDYLFLGAIGGWFGGSFGAANLETEATMRNELGAGAGP